MSIKYCFKVYSRNDDELITQVITDCSHMLDTLETLNKLGIVKGYILDDNESEVK